jgi:hypothetical protein
VYDWVAVCDAVDEYACAAFCLAVNVNALPSTAACILALVRLYADWTSPLPTKPLPVASMV